MDKNKQNLAAVIAQLKGRSEASLSTAQLENATGGILEQQELALFADPEVALEAAGFGYPQSA